MKKGFASISLLLLFAGCLPLSPSAGVKEGAKGGQETTTDRSEDLVIPGGTTDPVPGMVDPGPPAGPEPTARSLPTDLPAGPDVVMRTTEPGPLENRPLALGDSGPIEPKSEVAGARPLHCTSHRLRYGSGLSLTVSCIFPTPMKPADDGSGTFPLRLLLEKNVSENQSAAGPWTTEADGIQVRLLYSPAVAQSWESLFVDATTLFSPEGHNVLFPSLPLIPGFLNLYVFHREGSSADFQSSALKPFPDKATYETMFPQTEAGDFILAGRIEVIAEPDSTTKPALDRRLFRMLPAPEPTPESGGKMLFRNLKDIDLSEP